MAGEQLKQLSEQISFLIKVEQDSLDECVQEIGSLLVSIEKMLASASSDRLATAYEMIRDRLSRDYARIKDGYADEINYLKNQLEIVKAGLALEKINPEKLIEVEKIILQDTGVLEKNESFKDRILASNQESRQEFLEVVSELQEAIETEEEDFLEEYAIAYSDESADSEDIDEQQDDEESFACALDNPNLTEEEAAKAAADCCCLEDENKPFDLTTNEELVSILKEFCNPIIIKKSKDEEK